MFQSRAVNAHGSLSLVLGGPYTPLISEEPSIRVDANRFTDGESVDRGWLVVPHGLGVQLVRVAPRQGRADSSRLK